MRGVHAGTRCGCSPPGRYDNLPGLPFPAAADAYPGKDDVADYLQAYAAEFRLPVRLNTEVTSLTRTDGVYVAETGARRDRGPAGGARHRTLPGAVHPAGRRAARPRACTSSTAVTTGVPMTSRAAGSWSSAPRTRAARSRWSSPPRTVELAVGQRIPTIPQRPLGRDVWSWATAAAAGRGHRGLPARTSACPGGTR